MNTQVKRGATLSTELNQVGKSEFPPNPPCPHHHWVTVEVVSGRGMMPNLTGVEPYLYSLHSRFCFKGFVYTCPINHLLPSHNPTAFKVCASPGDNVQHRCQYKSHLLLLRKETKVHRPLVILSAQVSLLSSHYAALGLDRYLDISLQVR